MLRIPPAAVTEPLRRPPTQRRSRERVERILESADALLAERGADALTTREVALAADISVGSLYFWFPDKESIAQALALRYWDELGALVREVAESDPLDPAAEILDVLASGFRCRPGFLALWFGGLRSDAIREATRPRREAVAADLQQMLTCRAPHMDPAEAQATASMLVLIGDAVLREAFRLDSNGSPALLEEGVRVLRSYIDYRLKEATHV